MPPRRRGSIQPCSSGSTSVGRARPTACDCGAVPVRAAGRATVGPKTVLLALPARPGWIGSAVGSQARDADADTWCASGPSSRATTKSSTLSLCAARKPPGFSRTFPGNFLEVFPKLLGSCSEVARKFPGGVEAVHAPSCDIPLPLAMFGGRRTACAAGLHVGMGHCTGAAQTRGIPSGTSWLQARQVPQVGSPEVAHCKSDWAQPRARTWSDGEGGSATGYAPVSEAPRQHCMLLTYEKPGGGPKSFCERRS